MSITSPKTPDGSERRDLEFAKGAVDVSDSEKSDSFRLGESEGGAWATGGNIESYKPIAEYEGAHRWDPSFEWTEKEETRLVRRVSLISGPPSHHSCRRTQESTRSSWCLMTNLLRALGVYTFTRIQGTLKVN